MKKGADFELATVAARCGGTAAVAAGGADTAEEVSSVPGSRNPST